MTHSNFYVGASFCKNCRFGINLVTGQNAGFIECHGPFPVVPNSSSQNKQIWAVVAQTDWCGSWEPELPGDKPITS